MKEFKRVCIVSNAYVLFQYFMLSSLDEIDSTFFVFTKEIPNRIAERFSHVRLCLPSKRKFINALYLIYLNIVSDFRWPFFKKCQFWGQDNLLITSPLIKNRQIILPEDGLLNYNFKPVRHKFKLMRRFLFGNLLSENGLGYSSNVSKLYLTGAKDVPKDLAEKVKIVNYAKIWNSLNSERKKFICDVFGLKQTIIDYFSDKRNVLFTQPLSEDGLVSEEEKIEIYRRVLSGIPTPVLIKCHPRETTNYKKYFPKNEIFTEPIPLELLSLVGVKFENVYTLFSTSVLNLPYSTNIHWYGTYNSKKLMDIYGKQLDQCPVLN